MKIFSSGLAIDMTMRLALILILSSFALSQDQDIGKLLWNLPGTAAGFEGALIGKELEVGGSLLDMGSKGLNSLFGTDKDKSNANNLFLEPAVGGSTPDITVEPIAGGSTPDSPVGPTAGGSASDSTVNPVAGGSAPGDTAKPATGKEDTVEQTNGKVSNEISTNPPPNLLDQPSQPEPRLPEGDKPAQIELGIDGNSTPPKTSVDHECDSNAPNSDNDCGQPTPRIIWPTGCDSAGIREALISADIKPDDIRTVDGDCGAYLLTAPMTEQQIDRVRETAAAAIKIIVSDDPVISDGLSGTSKPSRRKKNRRDKLITVEDAPIHLCTITGPWRDEFEYVYPEHAGRSITGYMLVLTDQRMESTNPEFTDKNIIKSYIHALAPARERASYDDQSAGTALSLVSLVGGKRYVVSKEASLILVTMAPTTSSFLSGLKVIERRLRNQLEIKNRVLARTVVMTPIGFRSLPILFTDDPTNPMAADRTNEQEAKRLIQVLIDELQVVFVCAAGEIKVDVDETFVKEPYQWPANWASMEDSPPIITVGGLSPDKRKVADGRDSVWLPGSVGGDSVTVYAPYYVSAHFGENAGRPAGGTAYSAALTMGLIMDYMSRRDVRDELTLYDNELQSAEKSTALKMRDYTVGKAYPRVAGGPRVIWNGLRLGGTIPP